MKRKLIFAALALGLFVPPGGRALATPLPFSDTAIVGTQSFSLFEPFVQLAAFRNTATLPFIGVQLLQENSSTVVSDQLYTLPNASTGNVDLWVRSDPDLVDLAALGVNFINIPETGGVQDLSSIFNFPVLFQSDIDPVPEPATFALLATGALPLLVARRLRSRRARLGAARA